MSMMTRRVRRHSIALSVGVTVALTLGGCGADPSPDSPTQRGATAATPQDTATSPSTESGADDASSSLPDPCSWLTASDIESVVGTAFEEGARNPDLSTDFQNICEWWAADGSVLFVQVLVTGDAASLSTQRQSAEDVLGATSDVSVAGATDAYTVTGGSILGMAVGDNFVQVSLVSSSPDDVTTDTVALAGIVAANA
jgi:hypothetical protein